MQHFNNEQESINYFTELLINHNFTDVNATQATNQYCYYDISATKNDRKYRFELKNRGFESTKYGDIMCEDCKVSSFEEDKYNGEIDNAYIINFFSDGWCSSSVFNSHTTTLKKCPRTTDFDCHDYVLKRCCLYPQTKINAY